MDRKRNQDTRLILNSSKINFKYTHSIQKLRWKIIPYCIYCGSEISEKQAQEFNGICPKCAGLNYLDEKNKPNLFYFSKESMKSILSAEKIHWTSGYFSQMLKVLTHNQKEIYNYIEKEFKEINQKLDLILERLSKNR